MDDIEVVNLVPKFLSYYHMVKNSGVDVEKRWRLWEEHYNFAAIPPGEQGKVMARKLLDNAWDKYRDNLLFIVEWEPEQENFIREIYPGLLEWK